MDGASLPLPFVLRPQRLEPEGLHESLDERTAGTPRNDDGRARRPAHRGPSDTLSACYHMFPAVSAVLQPPSPGLEHVRLIGGVTVLSRVIVNVLPAFFDTATIA
jgi:hypothetical protein